MQSINYSSLEIGQALPPLTSAPISRTTLGLFAGASGDHNPIHIDIDFARKAGMDDVFAHGMLSMAYLGRMLTGWVSQRALKTFSVRFTSVTNLRDAITCTGKIVGKDDDERLVTVDIEAADQTGDVKLSGQAVFTF